MSACSLGQVLLCLAQVGLIVLQLRLLVGQLALVVGDLVLLLGQLVGLGPPLGGGVLLLHRPLDLFVELLQSLFGLFDRGGRLGELLLVLLVGQLPLGDGG